jgi:hypothetical protein
VRGSPIRSIDQFSRPPDHIAFGAIGLVRRHKVAVVLLEGRGDPRERPNHNLNIVSPRALAALDNHGRLLVNFYSESLLCVRLPAVTGAGILTIIILTFHALTFA